MFPSIDFGPFVLPTAGLVYILGIWFSLNAAEWGAKQTHQPVETIYTLAVTAVFTAFLVARLAFVVEYWAAFRENLVGIVWPLTNGYNVWAGGLAGTAAAFFYGRYKQLSPLATLDALVPGLVVGLITISLADFLAGPGFGDLTEMPWGVTQFGLRRHPVQVYEILFSLAALWVWRQVATRQQFTGQVFLVTAVLLSFGRLFIDAYRANAWLTNNGYHIWQIISLLILLTSLVLLARLSTRLLE